MAALLPGHSDTLHSLKDLHKPLIACKSLPSVSSTMLLNSLSKLHFNIQLGTHCCFFVEGLVPSLRHLLTHIDVRQRGPKAENTCITARSIQLSLVVSGCSPHWQKGLPGWLSGVKGQGGYQSVGEVYFNNIQYFNNAVVCCLMTRVHCSEKHTIRWFYCYVPFHKSDTRTVWCSLCLLYTSDAADDYLEV